MRKNIDEIKVLVIHQHFSNQIFILRSYSQCGTDHDFVNIFIHQIFQFINIFLIENLCHTVCYYGYIYNNSQSVF